MTVGARQRRSLALAPLAFAAAGLMFAACSGGGGTIGSTGFSCVDVNGQSSRVLCLQSCNLGCSTTGCARTDIAQNEIIILRFSEAVDRNTINSSSIRFRTPSGDEPVGEFLVNGEIVEFVPTLTTSGGQTFFGFTTGETYTMTIIGGNDNPAVVRSTSGKPFGQTVTCTLQSVNGIVDLNNVPPAAEMIEPPQALLTAAPLNTKIKLQFNELIDATPFLSGTQSPVEFAVRRTVELTGGGYDCDPDSTLQVLNGTQSLSFDPSLNASILTFTPSQPLPGNVCVEVNVTDGVSDLSGRPAQPQSFVFRTVQVPLAEFEIEEDFVDSQFFDANASAGEWGGGSAMFARIGGDGRHGEFVLAMAADTGFDNAGRRVYQIDCNNTVIDGQYTTTGASIPVSDGRFYFSSFVLPSSAELRFIGDTPPIITASGRVEINGVIDVSGQSLSLPTPTVTVPQVGGAGGIFAGSGGNGGDKCDGLAADAGDNGRAGTSARLMAGHAYLGSVAGTGGAGSTIWPASGNTNDVLYGTGAVFPVPGPGLFYSLYVVAGGSGGGGYTAGEPGFVDGIYEGTAHTANEALFKGPSTPASAALQFFPFPAPTGLTRSSLHFLAGGGGGGGAASNTSCAFAQPSPGGRSPNQWAPGLAGGGGGGAMALRSGRFLRLAQSGRLLAAGGSAANNVLGTSIQPQAMCGGGGAGGSIVLQSGGTADLAGVIDVRGGAGGTFTKSPNATSIPQWPAGARIESRGGNGGSGMVRFETPTTPVLASLPMQPPPVADNVGELTELDDLVAIRSSWYSTGLIFGPDFARYEIYATVDGVPQIFSDDPAVPGSIQAGIGAPIRALFQAVNVDVVTGDPIEAPQPWKTSVRSTLGQSGIASDGRNGYRFMLIVDHTLATNVVVDKVVVVYRN